MKILGIDPGSALCGWAVIESDGQNQKLVESGCVKTNNKDTTADRLRILHDELSAIIKKHKPREAAVEELFFVQNVKTGIAVGQARGVILLTLAKNDIKIAEYKPTQIKMALTGYGHADKKQVQSMVKCILKLESIVAQDDENDAVAVALCHCQSRTSFNLHAKPMNGLAKIAKSPRESTIGQTQTRDTIHTSNDDSGLVYPDLSYKIVGALFDTFKQLGPGLPERYYYSVVREKLTQRHLSFSEQQKVDIAGLSAKSGRFLMDFVVEGKIVVELKVGSRFLRKDINQIMNYLRQTNMRLGIIARFAHNEVVTKRLLLGKKI